MTDGEGITPPAFDTEDEAFALALAQFSEIYSGCFANAAFLQSLDDAGCRLPNGDGFVAPVPFNHDDGDSRV